MIQWFELLASTLWKSAEIKVYTHVAFFSQRSISLFPYLLFSQQQAEELNTLLAIILDKV